MYDDAFLTRLTAGLAGALPAWGLEPDTSLQLLTISENATYFAETPQGNRLILRVHRPNYHTAAEIESELAWITALARDNIVVTPVPLPAADGRFLVGFADGRTERLAVAFTFMPGCQPDAQSDLRHWYGHLGEITARLHLHAGSWKRPGNFARKIWNFETIIGAAAHWGDWRLAPGLNPAGIALLEQVATLLQRQTSLYGDAAGRFGLVHCDMRAANLLVEGERMAVIDFDDCGLSWFAYDFAASISFMEHEPFVPALMRAWVAGYRKTALFPPEDEAMLPVFVMLRRLQLTAWVASHAETPTAQACGEGFARDTVALGAAYLRRHGMAVPA